MATMKFKNVLQPPTQGSEDGMYYVKKGDKFEPVLVSGGKPYEQNKVIAEYVHSGNLEVKVESADFDTNTFYAPYHGLNDGDRIIDVYRYSSTGGDANVANIFKNAILKSNRPRYGYFVINADIDTFQVSATAGGNAISANNETSFEVYHFEKVAPFELKFNELNLSSICNIEMSGNIVENASFIGINNVNMIRGWNIIGGFSKIGDVSHSLNYFSYTGNTLTNTATFKIALTQMTAITMDERGLSYNNAGEVGSYNRTIHNMAYNRYGAINSLRFIAMTMSNDTRITLTGY